MEIGYSTLEVRDPLLAPLEAVPVLHWHGDTFDLPPDTEVLASTELYPHQGFRRGSNILALQFHVEMGESETFETWVERGGRGIAEAGTTPEHLRADQARYGPPSLVAGQAMIADWLAALS
jgi:GMP synthase (glutamine-hydrolysing)